jgi:adenosylmethionine-8-amino-7-oxononanoate aminotransferase
MDRSRAAAELAATLPGDLSKLYFLCSGSEAVEAALKLARQYWVDRGRPNKHRIIALGPGYHGSTLLALSASAREAHKAPFRPWLVDVHRIPAPYPYRCECGGRGADCPVCSAAVLEEAIEQLGADNVAAFIAEPVGGSSTVASTPRPDYFKRVREICDRHAVLFVADEVLVGMGRTGTWWAIEPYGVTPDILTLGKGIAGGYAALSAIAAPERIIDVLAKASGSFIHAQTFSHHPIACAARVATVRHLKERGLVGGARAWAACCTKAGSDRQIAHVGEVRAAACWRDRFVEQGHARAISRARKFAERFSDAAIDRRHRGPTSGMRTARTATPR